MIPQSAYLLIPKGEQVVVYPKQGSQTSTPKRFIYGDGKNPQWLDFQKDQLTEFQNYVKKQAEPNFRQEAKEEEPITLLKMLHANKFDFQKALSHYGQYKQWARQFIPRSRIDQSYRQQMDDLLKTGVFYVLPTRDQFFKPIFVVHVGRLLKVKPKLKLFLDTFGYFLQTIIDEMLIEGQVETWNVIVDVDKSGVFSFAGELFDLIKFLSKIFIGRMYRCFIINYNFVLKMVWGAVSAMMDEEQNDKCKVLEYGKIFQFLPKNALEKRHGGTLDELESFWPIDTPERLKIAHEYQKSARGLWNESNKLISQQEYFHQYYKKGRLCRSLNLKITKKFNSIERAKRIERESNPNDLRNYEKLNFQEIQNLNRLLKIEHKTVCLRQFENLPTAENLPAEKKRKGIRQRQSPGSTTQKQSSDEQYEPTKGLYELMVNSDIFKQKSFRDIFNF